MGKQGFRHLVKYIEENGHARPPQGWVSDGYRLGAWIRQQRTYFAKGNLPRPQRQAGEKLPCWEWEPQKTKWQEAFRRLEEYVALRGDAQVDAMYTTPDGYRLGAWVAQQRYKQSRGALDPDRFAQLDEVKGWEWRIGTGNSRHRRGDKRLVVVDSLTANTVFRGECGNRFALGQAFA